MKGISCDHSKAH